mgnify:CR=1 FL=1
MVDLFRQKETGPFSKYSFLIQLTLTMQQDVNMELSLLWLATNQKKHASVKYLVLTAQNQQLT